MDHFCKNSWRLLAVHYFPKTLHHGGSTEFQMWWVARFGTIILVKLQGSMVFKLYKWWYQTAQRITNTFLQGGFQMRLFWMFLEYSQQCLNLKTARWLKLDGFFSKKKFIILWTVFNNTPNSTIIAFRKISVEKQILHAKLFKSFLISQRNLVPVKKAEH